MDDAAMRLDDLPRDRQAESGILAETLIWTVGIETFENPFESMVGDARPVVVHQDFESDARRAPVLRFAAGAAERNAHAAGGLGKGAGVVDEVVEHLAESRIVAEHQPV